MQCDPWFTEEAGSQGMHGIVLPAGEVQITTEKKVDFYS